jgi:hypothetical protein
MAENSAFEAKIPGERKNKCCKYTKIRDFQWFAQISSLQKRKSCFDSLQIRNP